MNRRNSDNYSCDLVALLEREIIVYWLSRRDSAVRMEDCEGGAIRDDE